MRPISKPWCSKHRSRSKLAERMILAILICYVPDLSSYYNTIKSHQQTQFMSVATKPTCPESTVKNEFAIYSYNFGGYREELESNLWIMQRLSEFKLDCYFFTENLSFKVDGWTMMYMNETSFDDMSGINKTSSDHVHVHGIPASRVTIKHLKFKGHPSLEKYRYLIHVDSNPVRMNLLLKWLRNGLLHYVKQHPQYSFFASMHPLRTNVQEEISELKSLDGHQPTDNLDKWDLFLLDKYKYLNKVRLPELHTWVIDREDKDFMGKWSFVYDTLIQFGLWRDQIVYSYAVFELVYKVHLFHQNVNSFELNCTLPNVQVPHWWLTSGGQCLTSGLDMCEQCNQDKITIGLLYYDEPSILRSQLKEWSSWSNTDSIEFMVIDDTSSKPAVTIVNATMDIPPVRVLTIQPPKLEWNIGGVRNLIAQASTSCSFIALDIDYIITEALMNDIQRAKIADDQIYFFERDDKAHPHPGIMLLNKNTYWKNQGCDEDFVGHYGYTDPHFKWRAEKNNITMKIFPSSQVLKNQPYKEASLTMSCDTKQNEKLFEQKKSGTIPWSDEYLRFTWKDITIQ